MENKKIQLDVTEISVRSTIGVEVIDSVHIIDSGDTEVDQDNGPDTGSNTGPNTGL